MKRFVAIAASLLVTLSSLTPAFAWGDEGHQTVGKIASLRIKPHTAQRLAQILRPGDTLANMATWADTVKERVGSTDPDPDTNAFLQDLAHNERNRDWHFVDLPLGCANYQTCTGFTPDNDIVHLINICIRTLQGNPDPNQPLTKRNALRLLAHFIGDLHQPLHVGVGFIDANGPNHTILIARDPQVIRQRNLRHDRGGNQLIIDNDRKNLHGFWDFELVRSLMSVTHKPTSDKLGTFLKQTQPPKPGWQPQGPVNTWAAQWATDSLKLSGSQTYRAVSIVRERTIPVLRDGVPLIRNGQPVTQTVYDIRRPSNYLAVNRNNVREQLAKGGFRLAKLLDAIFVD
ncbi:MAG: S1/P1 nuclease [Pyrinomonadaceae bacterium]|nr:S1/P1 nuclease [Pyrinomonadaceae bacterium]